MSYSSLKINPAGFFGNQTAYSSIIEFSYRNTLKRWMDIVFSLIAIVLLLPVYFLIGIGVWLSSSGVIIYKQERIGKNGKPFIMYKFRSMIMNAEKNGPALSVSNDKRVTSFGRFLRRYKLDELPQFFNVLIGDMSLVGHRPERAFYIKKIMERDTQYAQLLKYKPGITSLGQIKFGYAANVEEMVARLKYDLIYIDKCNFLEDIKLLFLTFYVIINNK